MERAVRKQKRQIIKEFKEPRRCENVIVLDGLNGLQHYVSRAPLNSMSGAQDSFSSICDICTGISTKIIRTTTVTAQNNKKESKKAKSRFVIYLSIILTIVVTIKVLKVQIGNGSMRWWIRRGSDCSKR